MKVAIVIACVLAALVVIGGGGAAYWVAGNVRVNDTVKAVNKDVDQMNAEGDRLSALAGKEPAFPDLASANTPADFVKLAQQFDAAAKTDLADLDQADASVNDATRLLDDAQRRVAAASNDWLTIPHRSRLDKQKRSLGYEQQAIGVSRELVAVARKQIQSARDLVSGASAFAITEDKLSASDLNGTLAASAQAKSEFALSAKDAEGAHMPSAWSTLLADFDKACDDVDTFVHDLQAGNDSAAQALLNTLDADGKAFDSIDTSSFNQDAYLTQLSDQIKSLEDKSNSLLK